MADLKIKPYELSVWEYVMDGTTYERKIAVIGSNEMTTPNAAYNIVLNKKVNGEMTLTFSMAYRYFDSLKGDYVINPFTDYLINERKIKLKYNDEWLDFIIRNHEESSDEMTWSYTATDAFVLELSKNGYNVEFNTELNNNQGSVIELGKTVLEHTDWRVDEEGSDKIVQFLEEPVYTCTVTHAFDVLDVSSGQTVGINVGETIYVFYSYIVNQDPKYVQFIRETDRAQYTYDDDNVITAPNYRITTDVAYVEATEGLATKIKVNNVDSITIGPVYVEHHMNRIVYKQLVTYDPVTEQVVDRYQIDYDNSTPGDVYHYKNYEYTTSQVAVSYITNGNNFEVTSSGGLTARVGSLGASGWEVGYAGGNSPTYPTIALVTIPHLKEGATLPSFDNINKRIEGFLQVKFNGRGGTNYENVIYNSGIKDNANLINSIAKGQEYVLRLRYGWSDSKEANTLTPGDSSKGLRAVVAKYETVQEDFINTDGETQSYWVNKVDPNGIILDFSGQYELSNNLIGSGSFIYADEEHHTGDYVGYRIDGVSQEVSTEYVYSEAGGPQYVWDNTNLKFVQKNSQAGNFFRNYYLTTAEARQSVSNATLLDPATQIGIFLYLGPEADTGEISGYYYIDDIQLTRCIRDKNNQIVTIGNIPEATVLETDCFYMKPGENDTLADIDMYYSIDSLASSLGVDGTQIKPLYNDDHSKILSVNESHSNCFNLLQTIAETFECWIRYKVEHNSDGSIALRADGTPDKSIQFKNYAGKENFAGFKYGINLSSIKRTFNSEEIVTKLIVDPIQSDYTDEGTVSIQKADANPSGESYLLNFDYFINKGLINDVDQCKQDIVNFNTQLKAKNMDLAVAEENRTDYEAALVQLNSKRTVLSELLAEARKNINQANVEFEKLTGKTYDQYIEDPRLTPSDNNNDDEHDYTEDILKNDTILDTIGKIYVNQSTINNYGGLYTNICTEYKETKEKCYGTETYGLTISTNYSTTPEIRTTTLSLTHYVEGFICQFKHTLGGAAEYTFTSGPNEKSCTLPEYYEYVVVTSVPAGYEMEPMTIQLDSKTIKHFKITPIEPVDGIVKEIEKLQKEKDQLEVDFYKIYGQFVQEGTWNSQDYIDSNLYYLDALQVSNNSAQPKVEYSIEVAEVSELEGLHDYDFDIGDKTYVEDTEFFGWDSVGRPIREEVIVSELEWHLDNPVDNSITVQNYKTRFEDLFQRLGATVQTAQYNEVTYAKTSSILNQNGTINQKLLLSSLNSIGGREYKLTSDGTILTSDEGLLIRDATNPQLLIKIGQGTIKISNTAGDTWTTAIDGNGINIGAVYTGTLNTQQVIIQNGDSPSFRWDKDGISAFKNDEEIYVKTADTTIIPNKEYYTYNSVTREYDLVANPVAGDLGQYYEKQLAYDLTTFVRFDQNGLYGIKNATQYKFDSIDEIEENANFGITWHGFFIRSDNRNGYVSITSDNDFQVMQNVPTVGGEDDYKERIKIGQLTPGNFGMVVKNDAGVETFKADSSGDVSITGTINALGGNFSNLVTVGKNGNYRAVDNPSGNPSESGWFELVSGVYQLTQDTTVVAGKTYYEELPYISIDGLNASIKSSNYQDGAGLGWMINKDGDAYFNNITARGAIKTAVFEYAEIQAVGGVFLFRPSSTIKAAAVFGSDLVVEVEKPNIFKVNRWCKVSNYYSGNADPDTIDQQTQEIAQNNGLTHVYKIKSINAVTESGVTRTYITLEGAAAMIPSVTTLEGLLGGALVDMGDSSGSNNYGIGINSSDNTVNLPARAISLFETEVNTSATGDTPKVTYKYTGILGTLPALPASDVNNSIYNTYQATKQGIYTDNLYIGDRTQYIAFYTDGNNRHLKISASELVYGYSGGSEISWDQHVNTVVDDAVDDSLENQVVIETSNGSTTFVDGTSTTTLTCSVYKGGKDITSTLQNVSYVWKTVSGNTETVIPGATSRTLQNVTLSPNTTSVYKCEVSYDE